MEDDDPWFWDVDRVVRELCTDQRSWVPKTASPRMPDPIPLERALREQEIDGSTLLTEVDEADLKDEFGLNIRGPRATIKHAIGELRYISPQYQAWKKRHSEKPLTSISMYSPNGAGSNIGRDSELGNSQFGSFSRHSFTALANRGSEWSPIARPNSSEQDTATEDHLTHGASWIANALGNKRRKLDLPSTQTNHPGQGNTDASYLVNGNELRPSEDIPARERQISVEGTGVISAASTAEEHLLSGEPVPEKKRKRIAPTLVTSEIIAERDRNIPTAADMVQAYNPQNIEPGVAYNGSDGKKRLIPILQSDSNPELRRTYQEQLLRKLASLNSHARGVDQRVSKPTEQVPRVMSKEKPADHESLAVGYLGKKKFPVDEIFYGGTMIGKELLSESDNEDFTSITHKGVSSGRRLYMHKIMRKYLLSKPRVIHRDGRSAQAIIPYSKYLIPMHNSPSFTLFHSGVDGKIHVTRVALSKLPELDFTKSKLSNEDDERHAQFNMPDNLQLGGPNSYDDWDPDFLDKYRYIDGGDTILPLYGESDENNEYDEETWDEIQKECGNLERPLLPLKKRHLTHEEIDTTMDEAIAQIVSKWRREKLPKLQFKAWKLWRKSRRDGTKRQQIREFQQHLDRINNQRLVSLRKEIHEEIWTSKKQVHRQTNIMEQSIFDREDLIWRISILEQRSEPQKPLPLNATHAGLKKPPRPPQSLHDDDGESIETSSQTSSSNDGLDDFIVNDDIDVNSAEDTELRHMDDEVEDATMAESNNSSDSEICDPAEVKNAEVTSGSGVIKTNGVISEAKSTISRELSTDDRDRLPHVRDSSSPLSSLDCQTTDVHSPEQPPQRPQSRRPRVDQKFPHEVIVITSDSSAAETATNIVTPQKPKLRRKTETALKREEISCSDTPVIELDSEDSTFTGELPPFNDRIQISKHLSHWERIRDRARLLIAIIRKKLDEKNRASLWDLVYTFSNEKLWGYAVQVLHALRDSQDKVKGMDQKTYSSLIKTIQLFEMYVNCRYLKRRKPLSPSAVKELEDNEQLFATFYKICYSALQPQNSNHALSNGDEANVDTDSDLELQSAARRKSRGLDSSASDVEEHQTPHKMRKRKIFENAYARSLREQDQERLREQEHRRQVLRQKLAKSGTSVNADRARIIINDGKFEYQGFVYINEEIGKRIKDHQIDGVRFMWSQIVANEGAMQGCLLAHTMGLGKTMQVITLLVAIAEAASSKDESVSSQIPPSLHDSRTLILCPPGLIDNWMDELLTWAPEGVLGYLRKVDSAVKDVDARLAAIESWDQDGGVLIMGYEMFRIYIQNKETKNRGAQLDKDEHNNVKRQLLEGPNIIVADEAHKMKNANASITAAAMMFKSRSRIALTGSPLANNVEEYHTMIEWVAPNYLGPATEFRAKYVEPIQAGLWNDSTPYERRRSLKMLGVLKEDLSPKVHRADMSVLRNDLKPKMEFVITVPLTDLQVKAYSLYVKSMLGRANNELIKDGKVQQTTLWHWLSVLSLLCNHPECFRAKLMERKEAAKREIEAKSKSSINSVVDMASDGEDVPDTTPIWKIGVSEDLIKQEMDLFKSFGSAISAFGNSNKVKILLQILDASRAAGDKVLIFSQSIPTLNYLEVVCKRTNRDYARLDGNTKISERQSLTKKFNTGKTEIYLISTTAGGLGLNLFGANRVIIFDFKFNPINEEQAVGRAYRIGQQKPVFVYRFVAGGTFEDKMQNKAVFKMQLASRVVDKKNPLAWAKKDAGEFLFEPKPVEQQDLSSFKGMDPKVLDPILDRQSRDSSIRAIVITDTFERHDNDELTAEEKKEVEQLLSDEQLKRSNPHKYAVELQRRQQELFKAKHQEAIAQPGHSPVGVPSPTKYSNVYRPTNAALPPQRSLQTSPAQTQPPTETISVGNLTNLVTRDLPGLSPILGANTRIVSGTSHNGSLLGKGKIASPNLTTFGVENSRPISEQNNPQAPPDPSVIPGAGPSADRAASDKDATIKHNRSSKTTNNGSIRATMSSNPVLLRTQPREALFPATRQPPDQQLRDAVKEACRSRGSLHEIDSEASKQIVKDITDSLRKAIETRMENNFATLRKMWEIAQLLRQDPNLINYILSGETDQLVAMELPAVNGSAPTNGRTSSPTQPSTQDTARMPRNNGLPATAPLSKDTTAKPRPLMTPYVLHMAPGTTLHGGPKTTNIPAWKQEASIQDLRTALQTALSHILEAGGKPLGVYPNIQEAAEKIALGIGKALAIGAENAILFDAAISSTLEFVHGSGNCTILTQKEMDFKKFAEEMVRKVSHNRQVSSMDGSIETRKSRSPISAEPSVRSLRTPLPKRPRKEPYRSPQAKVDFKYLPKVARLKSHVFEVSDPSRIAITSPPQPQLAQLPSWAIDEIERAKTGSSNERRMPSWNSRAPSQSQPPPSTP